MRSRPSQCHPLDLAIRSPCNIGYSGLVADLGGSAASLHHSGGATVTDGPNRTFRHMTSMLRRNSPKRKFIKSAKAWVACSRTAGNIVNLIQRQQRLYYRQRSIWGELPLGSQSVGPNKHAINLIRQYYSNSTSITSVFRFTNARRTCLARSGTEYSTVNSTTLSPRLRFCRQFW